MNRSIPFSFDHLSEHTRFPIRDPSNLSSPLSIQASTLPRTVLEGLQPIRLPLEHSSSRLLRSPQVPQRQNFPKPAPPSKPSSRPPPAEHAATSKDFVPLPLPRIRRPPPLYWLAWSGDPLLLVINPNLFFFFFCGKAENPKSPGFVLLCCEQSNPNISFFRSGIGYSNP